MSINKVIATLTLATPFLFASNVHAAATCVFNVEVNEQMAYSAKSIDVPKTCKAFAININVKGTMPRSAMGHNIVITKG